MIHGGTFEDFGMLASVFVLLVTVVIFLNQAQFQIELSLLESEIQYLENSIDKFYLPLLNLLSCSGNGFGDLIKLEEINSYRYLAKQRMLSQFDDFYNECNETKRLHIGMSDGLLVTVKQDIDSINRSLTEMYRKFSKD